LNIENKNLQIREDPDTGVYLAGVCNQKVTSATELLDFYAMGDQQRQTALTKLVRFITTH
jgi:hypothetical protein